tara:strand:+ start:48 stop:527 length:480 start_codon:yes stop_codon:yes gene_type:complete
MDNKFVNDWNLWYHHEKNNWSIKGFRNIYKINNIKSFWKLFNSWDKIGGVNNKHFFIMKNDIHPIWEHKDNISGGCWSFKVSENQAFTLWEDLSKFLVCEKISKNSDEINGISVCLKKNNFTVIKIWNKNSKKNSITELNQKILKKWGTDIIYIAHITE